MAAPKSRAGRDFCITDLDPTIREFIEQLAKAEFRPKTLQAQVLLKEALTARGLFKAE